MIPENTKENPAYWQITAKSVPQVLKIVAKSILVLAYKSVYYCLPISYLKFRVFFSTFILDNRLTNRLKSNKKDHVQYMKIMIEITFYSITKLTFSFLCGNLFTGSNVSVRKISNLSFTFLF